jgi:hypothetical protein
MRDTIKWNRLDVKEEAEKREHRRRFPYLHLETRHRRKP